MGIKTNRRKVAGPKQRPRVVQETASDLSGSRQRRRTSLTKAGGVIAAVAALIWALVRLLDANHPQQGEIATHASHEQKRSEASTTSSGGSAVTINGDNTGVGIVDHGNVTINR